MDNTNTPFVCDDTRVIPHLDIMELHEIERRRTKDSIAEAVAEFRKAFKQVCDALQKNSGNYDDFEERMKAMENLLNMLRIFLSFKSALIEEIC